jgi:hypothetical protein
MFIYETNSRARRGEEISQLCHSDTHALCELHAARGKNTSASLDDAVRTGHGQCRVLLKGNDSLSPSLKWLRSLDFAEGATF